jgi:hypothetical protein
MQKTDHSPKKMNEVVRHQAPAWPTSCARRAPGVPRRADRQLEIPIPPWPGARYDAPYMSGEVAILPHGSTESTDSQATPSQPPVGPDARHGSVPTDIAGRTSGLIPVEKRGHRHGVGKQRVAGSGGTIAGGPR